MAEYKALRDFKYMPRFKKDVVSVKKGDTIHLENSVDFPELEDKMIRAKYVRKPKELEENV